MNPIRSACRRAYSLAVAAGLAPYRRPWPVDTAKWDALYRTDALDYYDCLREQGRLEILIGMIKAFPRRPRVLDIGCGDGAFRARMHDDDLIEYVGIDISEVAIAKARVRRLANSRFVVGSYPGRDEEPFDIVTLTDVICYVPDLDVLLRRLVPRLAPDGWLLVLQYRHPGDDALHRTLAKRFNLIDSCELVSHGKPRLAWWIGCYSAGNVAPTLRETPVEALAALRA